MTDSRDSAPDGGRRSQSKLLSTILSVGPALLGLALCCKMAAAQDWAARFPSHSDCKPSIRSSAGGQPSSGSTARAGLVVRPVQFGTHEPVSYVEARLIRLGGPDSATLRPSRNPDTATVIVFDGVEAGSYSLILRRLGFARRTDTLTLQAGAADTVRVAVEVDFDGYRNTHNCRPRGFRRPSESACVTDGDDAERQLDYARRLATPEEVKSLKLPSVDTNRIALVRDERVCERASRRYGQPDDPPRRVIVVQMDHLYLVYDPFEPVAAGEWNIHEIYDRSWHLLVSLAS